MGVVLICIVALVLTPPVVVTTVYLSVRAAALAFFKTKREHNRLVLQELQNGERRHGA